MQVVRTRIVWILVALFAGVCNAGELNIGVNAKDEAKASDTGLPAYPGSKPYKENEQSGTGANVNFSAPFLKLKVAALNLESSDRPDRIAAFYRRALGKYGEVVECSDSAKRREPNASSSKNSVSCDANDPGEHSVVYKVGTDDNFRLVAIKPHEGGTRFSLVHVNTAG